MTTIKGVEITDDTMDVMLLASLKLERKIGRKLTGDEMEMFILAFVDCLAARERNGVLVN